MFENLKTLEGYGMEQRLANGLTILVKDVSIDNLLDRFSIPEVTITGLVLGNNRYPWYANGFLPDNLTIKNVIYNDPATIVFWKDGTKTVVKKQDGEDFDPEKGLAMAICKKIYGQNKSGSNYYDLFRQWLPKEDPLATSMVANPPEDDATD